MPQGNDVQTLVACLNMQTERLDDLISVARQQPARTAAGLNAAMNGVVAHAVVKGGW
jgi:hypothetical protein